MARVTAIELRTLAREAMLSAGGRGFMRFLPPGGLLLATDAVRRCAGDAEKAALTNALDAVGFVCCEQDGLLMLTPTDAVLSSITCSEMHDVDWHSPLHQVQALGAGWIRRQKQSLTPDGRQLIIEALRLSWQPMKPGNALDALRAQAAVMLRKHDGSGFYEAGAVLLDWCDRETGGNADEA